MIPFFPPRRLRVASMPVATDARPERGRPTPSGTPDGAAGRALAGAMLLCAALALSACGGAESHIVPRVPIPEGPGEALDPVANAAGRSEWSGPRAATQAEMYVTARDDRGWGILWQLIGRRPPGRLPEGAMAVAVLLGPRPSVGFRVEITGVERRGEAVVVTYREQEPGPDMASGGRLTAPYAVRLVRRTAGEVLYQRQDAPAGS